MTAHTICCRGCGHTWTDTMPSLPELDAADRPGDCACTCTDTLDPAYEDWVADPITSPGVYDLAEEIYHGDPVPERSLSCSGAKLLIPPDGCPAKFHWARHNRTPSSRAMELGSAAHAEVLGTGWPVNVWDGKTDNYRTNAAQDWAKEVRDAGRIPLLRSEAQQVKDMAAAIRAHPTAQLLLGAEEVWREQSFFWRDPATGIMCRARLDAAKLPGQIIAVDYKTTKCAERDRFARDAANYKYHWQDAHYRDAIYYTLGVPSCSFLFVVQEKEPPYLVAVYELSMADVLLGREYMARARAKYAECTASGAWPGWQDPGEVITRISLPPWAR